MSTAAPRAARGRSQAEVDLDSLLRHSGGNDINRGVRASIVEQADSVGIGWAEITDRLTEAGLLYGRTYATEPPWFLADYGAAHEWALGEVEREQRQRKASSAAAAEASIGMIHGPRGLGKTNLQLGIAAAVASMKPFLQWEAPEPRRVLVVDGELPLTDLQNRVAATIKALDCKLPEPDYLRFVTPDLHEHGLPDLSTPNGQALLEPFLDGVALLILDNISTLFRSGVENDAESWGPVQAWALKLRRLGIATWFIHHSGKGGLQRGTSRREDVLDTVLALRRPPDYREADGARFEVHFEKHRGFHGDDAEPFEAQLATDEDDRQAWTVKDLDDRKTERVAEMLNDGEKVRGIAKALGVGLATVDRHKKRAIARGVAPWRRLTPQGMFRPRAFRVPFLRERNSGTQMRPAEPNSGTVAEQPTSRHWQSWCFPAARAEQPVEQ